jgi:peptide deformylase
MSSAAANSRSPKPPPRCGINENSAGRRLSNNASSPTGVYEMTPAALPETATAPISVPGFRAHVARPQYVTIRAQDAAGKEFEMRGEGLLARAFCHEIDHLNGILFIAHVSMLKRDMIKRKIRKMKKAGEW